jgi:hypothetical protein
MAFDYLDWTAVCGMPFDRHQPVRQMNGAKSPPPPGIRPASGAARTFAPQRISL